jgi:hypothetical protein
MLRVSFLPMKKPLNSYQIHLKRLFILMNHHQTIIPTVLPPRMNQATVLTGILSFFTKVGFRNKLEGSYFLIVKGKYTSDQKSL